jgi:hypothetical protein
MAFLAGVDEAGYGPFVGPLTIGFSLFRVHDPQAELWPALEPAAARKSARRAVRSDRRLWLDDSKIVHQGPHGRARLERSVAAFRELCTPGKHDLEGWIGEPPCGAARLLHAAPWHASLIGPLCPGVDADRTRLDAAALRRALDAAGAALAGFGARAVPANEWNRALAEHGGNKGEAHLELTMEIVRHVLRATGGAPLRIELDRLGGRLRYAERLRTALGARSVTTHGENAAGSAYTIELGGRTVQVRFSEGADGKHAPVALASLAAKQTRERLMDLHNEWFGARLPGLAPTKGYALDGRRWLREVEPRLAELELGAEFVRRVR